MKRFVFGVIIIILVIIVQSFAGYHWLLKNDISKGYIENAIAPTSLKVYELDQKDAAALFEALNTNVVFDTTSNPGHLLPFAFNNRQEYESGYSLRVIFASSGPNKNVTIFATRLPEDGGKGIVKVNGIVHEAPGFFAVLQRISKERNFNLSRDAQVQASKGKI